jgi:hypothetical protein
VRGKLFEIAGKEGGEERANAALEKYREIDREVYQELADKERKVFGADLQVAAN